MDTPFQESKRGRSKCTEIIFIVDTFATPHQSNQARVATLGTVWRHP